MLIKKEEKNKTKYFQTKKNSNNNNNNNKTSLFPPLLDVLWTEMRLLNAVVEIFLSVGKALRLEIRVPVDTGRSETPDFRKQSNRQLTVARSRTAYLRDGRHVGSSQSPLHRF